MIILCILIEVIENRVLACFGFQWSPFRYRTASRIISAIPMGKERYHSVCHKKFLGPSGCWREFLSRRHQRLLLLVSPLQHGNGGRHAANENQHIAEHLNQPQACPVGDWLHHGTTHDDKRGGPQGNHSCSCQRDPQQHIGELVANHPADGESEDHPVRVEVVLYAHEERQSARYPQRG